MPSSAASTKRGGSWPTFIGVPVSRANDLLSASYQLYQHTTVLRTLSVRAPRSASCARPNRRAGHTLLLRISTHAVAEISHAPRWGSWGAGEGGSRRARDGVVEPQRACLTVVTALAVQDV